MRTRASAVASRSTRAGSWVATTTALAAASSSSVASSSSAPASSSALNGSSRITSSRLVEQHAAEPEPLAHPTGERRDALVAHLPEPEALEQHPDPLAPLGDAVEPARRGGGSRAASARGRRAARGRGSRSTPARAAATSPAVGASSPASTRRSVVLPEPFGPVTSRNPPASSSTSTLSRTRFSPKRFVSLRGRDHGGERYRRARRYRSGIFERFTERARQVVVSRRTSRGRQAQLHRHRAPPARIAARRGRPRGAGARVASRSSRRAQVAIVGQGTRSRAGRSFTPRVEGSSCAPRGALAGHNYIGTEHICSASFARTTAAAAALLDFDADARRSATDHPIRANRGTETHGLVRKAGSAPARRWHFRSSLAAPWTRARST